MLSYWEKTYLFKKPDFCVVGAGIVGLTTAYFIKKKHPQAHVIVAERGFLPDGASTKNAGFACFGSVTELKDDLSKWPENKVIELAEKRFQGLELLLSLVGQETISYEPLGGYELFEHAQDFETHLEVSKHYNQLFSSKIGKNVYTDARVKINEFGFKKVNGLIKNNYEGQLDTGKLNLVLEKIVREAGIPIYYGLEIDSMEDTGTNVVVHTKNQMNFHCGNLIITTNGFARQLLPELDVIPARAQVLITKPIKNLKFKGSFHYDKGYYYFRNIHDRVLFGGGRNLDFETEKTWEKGTTPLVQNRLIQLLHDVILPETDFEIDYTWSGTMGVGSEKKTIVKQVTPHIFCGVRMGGMGVALGSLVGKEISELV